MINIVRKMGSIEKAVRESIKEREHLRLRFYLIHALLAIVVSLAGVSISIHAYSTVGRFLGSFMLVSSIGMLSAFVIVALAIAIEIVRS